MPILYFLKNPRSTLAVQGVINEKLIKTLAKEIGPIVSATAMDGKAIIIPADEKCNIAYIKQITTAEFDKAQAEVKKGQDEEKRIVRPEFNPGHRRIPGAKRKR